MNTPKEKLDYFFLCVEQYVDQLPLMDILIPDRTTENNIFGGFLRWVVETNGKMPLSLYFEMGSDIDVKCESAETISVFFNKVVELCGYIEYAGNAYGDSDGDCDGDEKDNGFTFEEFVLNSMSSIPAGNYMVYIPFSCFSKETNNNDKWIKYDISFCCDRLNEVDFTANALLYPNSMVEPQREQYFSKREFRKVKRKFNAIFPQHLAIEDIVQRRLQHINMNLTPKFFYRTYKLWSRGYRYYNESALARLEEGFREKRRFLHHKESIFKDDTGYPSIVDGKYSRVKVTQHCRVELTSNYIETNLYIKNMISDSKPIVGRKIHFGSFNTCFMEIETIVKTVTPPPLPKKKYVDVVVSSKIKNIANNNGWEVVGPRRRNRKVKSPSLSPTTSKDQQSSRTRKVATMKKTMNNSFVEFDASSAICTLPIQGSGLGITEGENIVYKAALITNNDKQQVVVVVLSIPKKTRYIRGWDGDDFKWRFERADVLHFLSYPNKIIKDDVSVVSNHDRTFKYIIGTTAKPKYGFVEGAEVCAGGIHAFADIESAWNYFGNSFTFYE